MRRAGSGRIDCSNGDLLSLDVENAKFPARFVIGQLANVIDVIASFHRVGVVQCDIKRNNRLAHDQGPGQLTDFGYGMPVSLEPHQVGAAHSYLALWTGAYLLNQLGMWSIKR